MVYEPETGTDISGEAVSGLPESDATVTSASQIPIDVATRVGSAFGFGVNLTPQGLTPHNGTLYTIGRGQQGQSLVYSLYTLNATTGTATRVGSATQFGVNERNPTGLTSHNLSLIHI